MDNREAILKQLDSIRETIQTTYSNLLSMENILREDLMIPIYQDLEDIEAGIDNIEQLLMR